MNGGGDMEQTKHVMQSLARMIDHNLPKGTGFFLMVFPFGEQDSRTANYVGNSDRKGIIKLLRETAYRFEREIDR